MRNKVALPIIDVRNLTAAYGVTTILENISFQVRESERFVILGGSGCGKSTLLKHIIGLERPRRGSITIDGIDIATAGEADFQAMLRRIGVLFQSGALLGSMTVAQNVALPIRMHTDLPQNFIDEIVRMKLELVHLSGYENHLPTALSGGMKKRAGLARAMALNPKILFFDEPSAGLDPITSAELDELILHINESLGTTMVIVTHELASIFAIGQRIIMLEKKTKSIIAEGSPAELREYHPNPLVRNFFNRQTEKMQRSGGQA